MAGVAGTNIVNSGLVFHFDLENSVKSWKGKPTTNIITSEGIAGMSGITYTYVGMDDGWKKYSISGTWNSGTYPFSFRINHASFSGGVAYSARCLLKTNVISKFATFAGLNYVNDPNMVNGGTVTTRSLGKDKKDGFEIWESRREGFIYSTGYANPTTNQTGYINSRPTANGVVFNASTDFVWVKEIQVEQGSFCTRYVNGVRLDTATIKDISRKKLSISPANMTYRKDDTPTFDGTNGYINCGVIPEIGASTTQFTASVWLKSQSQSARCILENGTNHTTNTFYMFQENATYFTFEVYGTNYDVVYANFPYQLNTWYNLVGVWSSGNRVEFYANGVNVSGTRGGVVQTSVRNGNTNMMVGARAGTSYFFQGEIPEVKIYNKALTAKEIKQNFEATRVKYGI